MINNMKILIGLLIVAAGLAYWVSQKDNQAEVLEQPLMPAWQSDASLMSKIDQVVLSQGDEKIALIKDGDHWKLNDGFYASIDPLFTLLQGLKNAVIVETKTANPENHARLDLSDADLKVLLSSNDHIMDEWHIGKKSAAGHTFVRKAGENQTYAVKDLGSITFSVDSWKLKTVLDVSAEDVNSVNVSPKDSDEISIKRSDESGDWVLANLPEGHQLKQTAYLEQVANGLSRFMIDDAKAKDVTDKEEVLSNSYVLNDATEINIKVFQSDEDYYLTIDSRAYSHYADWMMKIPEYKFNSLNRNIEEFIEPVATDPETEAPVELESTS